MKALKCDRCGNFYEITSTGYKMQVNNEKERDLCPNCGETFVIEDDDDKCNYCPNCGQKIDFGD